MSGTAMASLVNLEEFEVEARRWMTEKAYEFVASGAGNETTLRRNRSAWGDVRLLPDLPADVSQIDTGVKLFGEVHESPFLVAPMGFHQLVHPEGEIETTRGADKANCSVLASSFATVGFDETQRATQRRQWFQLYVHPDRGFTADMVEWVQECGCAAICLTTDLPVNSTRDREAQVGFELPPGMIRANLARFNQASAGAAHSTHGYNVYNAVRAADLTWKDVAWLRERVRVPLLLKGVLRPETVDQAIDVGCDGVIVSNHGGRSMDGVPATAEVLPGIAERAAGRMPVLVDGGIRRGVDVVRAMALGASAVLVGRPCLYGLAMGGADGVYRALTMLQLEFELALGLVGCSSASKLNRDYIFRS